MDVLEDLVKSLKEKPEARPVQAPVRHLQAVSPLVKSGPGGTIFNFGARTGHSIVDNYNMHLQHNADHEQASIAKGQAQDFQKALNEYVDKGEYQFNAERMEEQGGGSPGVHGGWGAQLSGSTDQQVVQAFKKGILNCNEGQTHAAGNGNLPQFGKSTIKMGGEEIVATSETDAALIEMMKSGGAFEE